jgi:hypothetical protein
VSRQRAEREAAVRAVAEHGWRLVALDTAVPAVADATSNLVLQES